MDDLVRAAIEWQCFTVFWLAGVVATLLYNPFFFADVQLSQELAVILANNPLNRVVEAVSNIVGAFRDLLRTFRVVGHQRFAVGPEVVRAHLSVEAAVLAGAVVPVLVLELQVVVKEVVSLDELAAVPLGHITSLIKRVSYKRRQPNPENLRH